MSRLGSSPAGRRVAVPRPQNDLYVVLLAIALGALVISCLLLAFEMTRYEWTVHPPVSQLDIPAALGWVQGVAQPNCADYESVVASPPSSQLNCGPGEPLNC